MEYIMNRSELNVCYLLHKDKRRVKKNSVICQIWRFGEGKCINRIDNDLTAPDTIHLKDKNRSRVSRLRVCSCVRV